MYSFVFCLFAIIATTTNAPADASEALLQLFLAKFLRLVPLESRVYDVTKLTVGFLVVNRVAESWRVHDLRTSNVYSYIFTR